MAILTHPRASSRLAAQRRGHAAFVAACQNAKAPGFEADDFLAAAAAKEEKRGGTVFIASGDRDTFQLVVAGAGEK